jgi:peptidoglycan/xylan/chitin deacetylase (PgdA/CDA1 family)
MEMGIRMRKLPEFGALVISLDFAIHWGVRYRYPANGTYATSLVGVRRVIPQMLRAFEEFEVAATWATVGFLFARSREELREFSPAVRPSYLDPGLSPYEEKVGDGEGDDPLHYAPSLIAAIRDTPRQEIGTHTFSHYYCCEPGQDREAFRADLTSAITIAQQHGIQVGSIVFPRNQHNAEYDDVLLSAGIRCFRGNTPGWMYAGTLLKDGKGLLMRGGRVLNAYVPLSGMRTARWQSLVQPNGLCNVPASLFLRPYSARLRQLESLRVKRIADLIHRAAVSSEIVHLYCHPHNFGGHLEENMAMLRAILGTFARYRASHGMQSLSMRSVAEIAGTLTDESAHRPRHGRAGASLER